MAGTVAVLFGGPSPEHDISILTGLQAIRALVGDGRRVEAIYWSKAGEFWSVPVGLEAPAFAAGVPQGASPLVLAIGAHGGFVREARGLRAKREVLEIEACVNCCHGGPGEDGTLQGALDLAGVPYTGPSAKAAMIGMDKLVFADLARAAGLPVLPRTDAARDPAFAGPWIVKPRFGGSSIGIEVITDRASLSARLKASPHFAAGAVIEPYREDLFDLQIALRRHPELTLSAIERPTRQAKASGILTYGDKYQPGGGMATAPRELPAAIKPEMAESIREIAVAIAGLIGSRGVCRVDFLASDDGELWLNEVNTIPGSLSHYLFIDPKEPFAAQLGRDLAEALARPTYAPVVQGADGSVLQSAASIAAKLA